ncbi:hypothetical protein BB558_007453 [Smittium angustum]|uniref:Uncharacterized protein n=1 Tax=Smittium angustum TaxID=133377 RepID=A0A2U1IUX6_SMIAN|nr:hypothetical protein BB558_007453 [Smittium angustum]
MSRAGFKISKTADLVSNKAEAHLVRFPIGVTGIIRYKQNSKNHTSNLKKSVIVSNNESGIDSEDDMDESEDEKLETMSGFSALELENAVIATIQGQGVQILDQNNCRVIREWNIPGRVEFKTKVKCIAVKSSHTSRKDFENHLNPSKQECKYLFAGIQKAQGVPKNSEGKSIWRWSDYGEVNNELTDLVKLPINLELQGKSKIFDIDPIYLDSNLVLVTVFENGDITVFDENLQNVVQSLSLTNFEEFKNYNTKVKWFRLYDFKREKTVLDKTGSDLSIFSKRAPKRLVLIVRCTPKENEKDSVSGDLIMIQLLLHRDGSPLSLEKYAFISNYSRYKRILSAGVNQKTKNTFILFGDGELITGTLSENNRINNDSIQQSTLTPSHILEEKKVSTLSGYFGTQNNKIQSIELESIPEVEQSMFFDRMSLKPLSIIELQENIIAVVGLKASDKKKVFHVVTIWDTKYNTILDELWVPDYSLYSFYEAENQLDSSDNVQEPKTPDSKKQKNSNQRKSRTGKNKHKTAHKKANIYYQSNIVDINSADEASIFTLGIASALGLERKNGHTVWTTSTFFVQVEMSQSSLAQSIKSRLINKNSIISSSQTLLEHSNPDTAPISHPLKNTDKNADKNNVMGLILSKNFKIRNDETQMLEALKKDLLDTSNPNMTSSLSLFLSENSVSPVFVNSTLELIFKFMNSKGSALEYLKVLLKSNYVSNHLMGVEKSLLILLSGFLFSETDKKIRTNIVQTITLLLEQVKDISEKDLIDLISLVLEHFENKYSVLYHAFSGKRDYRNLKRVKHKKKDPVTISDHDLFNFVQFKILLKKIVQVSSNDLLLRNAFSKLDSFSSILCLVILENWLYELTQNPIPYEKLCSSLIQTDIESPPIDSVIHWLTQLIDSKMNTILTEKKYNVDAFLIKLGRTISNFVESNKILSTDLMPSLLPYHYHEKKKDLEQNGGDSNRKGRVEDSRIMVQITEPNTKNTDYVIEALNW